MLKSCSSPPVAGLAPMQRYLRRRRRKEQDVRPPPHWFTFGSLRSFGKRLFNPPPSVPEERYIWYVSPRYTTQLEDVVADKHLSPLSRQDFEDYLQHVDGTVGNLYFLEWLNHYRQRYQEWAASVLPTHSTPGSSKALDLNIPSTSNGVYRTRDLWERLKDCQDRQLREEFAFARATFFESNASMRLNISDEVRAAVLFIPNGPPPNKHQALTDKLPSFPGQPEPSLFDEALAQINLALAAAFAKFLRLAFCNSGLWHSCIGHAVGVGILAAGLSLWYMGIVTAGRGSIAGSLPLIWIGVWFMLVSANGHCLGVYVTGDARQLYPHELDRPIAPGVVPPPVYSLALPPAPDGTGSQFQPSTTSFTRKASAASHLLPFSVPPTPPAKTYQPFRWAYCNNARRQSDGAIAMVPRRGAVDFSRPRDEEACTSDQVPIQPTEIELKLPPPRRTKDLPRQSLAMDVQQTSSGPTFLPLAVPTSSTRRSAVVDLSDGWDFGAEGRPDSPFSEENDFGIVVSDAFEEDMPYHPPEPSVCEEAPKPGWSVEPLPPLVPVPECNHQRRRTVPELLAHSAKGSISGLFETASRRGSKSSEGEREIRTQWPWPRKLFGAMTPVRSPIVRRAHWAMTVRTAIVASVVTFGMAIGFIR